MADLVKFRRIRWVALVAIAVGIVTVVLLQTGGAPRSSLPTLGAIPEFSLTAEDGRTITRDEFMGKISITDFIFTHCAGSCPGMTAQMASLQTLLGHYGEVQLVSISVDPERDTLEVLKNYAKSAGAQPGRWIFLTGEKKTLHQLVRNGFRLGVEEGGGSAAEPIIHSSLFVLLDRRARIRGYYDGSEDEGARRLERDIELLVGER